MGKFWVPALVLCLAGFLTLMPALSAWACVAVCLDGPASGCGIGKEVCSSQTHDAATEQGGPLCPASPDTCKNCAQCATGGVVMHLPANLALSLRPHVFSSIAVSSETVDRIFVSEIFQPPRA